jgi:hypothetical protein
MGGGRIARTNDRGSASVWMGSGSIVEVLCSIPTIP